MRRILRTAPDLSWTWQNNGTWIARLREFGSIGYQLDFSHDDKDRYIPPVFIGFLSEGDAYVRAEHRLPAIVEEALREEGINAEIEYRPTAGHRPYIWSEDIHQPEWAKKLREKYDGELMPPAEKREVA